MYKQIDNNDIAPFKNILNDILNVKILKTIILFSSNIFSFCFLVF